MGVLDTPPGQEGGLIRMEVMQFFVSVVFVLVMIASVWRTFSKAGEPGWASIVPIYNAYVYFKIADKPAWWIILLAVPVANLVFLGSAGMSMAENFGRSKAFGLGIAFLGFFFYPVLAFGGSKFKEQPPTGFAKAA